MLLVVAAFLPASHPVSGQIATPVELIRDINTRPLNETPTSLSVVGNRVVFVNDSVAGRELWSSDGTPAGTHLVKDIALGPASSNPEELTTIGTNVFFFADDEVNGRALWTSDGTESGTYLVEDSVPGTESTQILGMTAVNNTLFFFTATLGSHTLTLWKYTTSGLLMIRSDIPESSPFTASFNNELYFGVEKELWRSDGTSGGTIRITTLPNDIAQLIPIQNTLFLRLSNIAQVWKSDGTQAGTQPLTLPGGATFSDPVRLLPDIQHLFFTTGGTIWQTDGTNKNTKLLATKPNLTNVDVLQIGNVIYFGGRDPQHNSWELWRTDGTSAGTTLLTAVVPSDPFGTLSSLAEFKGQLVFLGSKTEPSVSPEPWISDGTVEGTHVLKQIGVIAGPARVGDRLFFYAQAHTDGGELWTSDGTEAGTTQISSTQHKTFDGILTSPIAQLQGALYVLGEDSSLWQSDGTANGTTIVKAFPFIPGPVGNMSSLYGQSLVSATDRLFFANALQFVGKAQLWTSDGTSGGTVPLATLEDVPSIPIAASTLNDTLVMLVRTNASYPSTYKLVTSDGTPAGTVNQGLIPGLSNSPVFAETSFNGKLFFVVPGAAPGLWQTDGSLGGTTQVAALSGDSFDIGTPVVANGRLFFTVSQNNQYELWTSDGTAAGTHLVQSLPATGNVTTGGSSIAVLNNTLFFPGDDGVHGRELWASDGAAAGTHLVADIFPGSASSFITNLATIHGTLLFSADDGIHGSELWASDGTRAGTRMVADIAPGTLDSFPSSFTAADGFVAFVADDGVTGNELHKIAAPNGVQLQLAAPSLVSGAPQSNIALPVTYGNAGATEAVSVTLTLTLGDGLSYLSDTSGISPTITGNVLMWTLPNTSFLIQRSFQVQIGTSDQPLGTRLPVELTVRAQDANGTPATTTAQSEVLIADQAYLPIVRR